MLSPLEPNFETHSKTKSDLNCWLLSFVGLVEFEFVFDCNFQVSNSNRVRYTFHQLFSEGVVSSLHYLLSSGFTTMLHDTLPLAPFLRWSLFRSKYHYVSSYLVGMSSWKVSPFYSNRANFGVSKFLALKVLCPLKRVFSPYTSNRDLKSLHGSSFLTQPLSSDCKAIVWWH